MKTIKTIIFSFAIFVLAVIGLAGCATTGMQRSSKASTTMQTMDNDIKLAVVELNATGASLNELIKSGQSDIMKAFNVYKKNVSKIEEMEKRFVKHADEMKARGKEYFQEWQKKGSKYKNSQIQKLSEQRRVDLGDIYGKIAENSIGVKSAFRSYVSDVNEILIFLSNDLTSNGIEAISPLSRKVVEDGNNLRTAIENVQSAIDTARLEMAQSGN